MPQMAPLNWLSLMIFFIIMFLIINSMNFYCFFYTPSFKKSKKNTFSSNWKWW